MTRRRYTDEERTEAVVELEAAGYPDKKGALQGTAKRLGIPPTTLKQWFTGERNPPPIQMSVEKTFDKAIAVERELAKVFDAMNNVRADASYKDLTIAAGVLLDKAQILNNQPSAIIRIAGMVRNGEIAPDEVRSRWPNIADEIISEAGIPLC